MPQRVCWGVLSTSNIGRVAVNPAIQKSSNGELLAVASRDLKRAQDFAAAAHIPVAYGNYLELLEDVRIQAVYIPLPNSLHRKWAICAAEHGKHVLCEKPLALSEKECREMETAATANGVQLMEAFMYRFHPRTQRIVELVRADTIGQPRMIRSSFSFRVSNRSNIRLNKKLGGGALMDVGCYCVNISRTLAGREPIEIQAIARMGLSQVDEELVGTFRFADGLLAQFDCALTLERREEFEIAGPLGSLVVPSAFLPGTGDTKIQHRKGRAGNSEETVAGADQYQLMVEHFADCVLNNRTPLYPASEAAHNMRVIEALYRSANAGGAVVKLSWSS